MMPGLGNPAQMRRMMKQLGMKSEEINAKRVIIELENGKIVIEEPSVTAMEIQGHKTYTVMGTEKSEESGEKNAAEIPEEDVRLVAAQAAVSPEKARKALEECEGDLAEAIKVLKK
jgi:nascent polypeptide-associated complex subunit alpha